MLKFYFGMLLIVSAGIGVFIVGGITTRQVQVTDKISIQVTCTKAVGGDRCDMVAKAAASEAKKAAGE